MDKAIDTLVPKFMEENHVPGVAVAIMRYAEVVAVKGFGCANLELSVPVSEDSVFAIGSLTKPFTATAIMLLVEEGLITLDDKLCEVLPGLPAAWNDITIVHMLTHTSGLRNYTNPNNVPEFLEKSRLGWTQEAIVLSVANLALFNVPGEEYAYSNTGYFLLGMVIEKVSGTTYGYFLKERIFQPLGMLATRLDDRREIITHRAAGYALEGGSWCNAEYQDPSVTFSAGGIISSIADLIKWDVALYREQLLPQRRLQQMWAPTALTDGTTSGYGLGWGVNDQAECRSVTHAGHAPGYTANLYRSLTTGLTTIMLCNANCANDRFLHFANCTLADAYDDSR